MYICSDEFSGRVYKPFINGCKDNSKPQKQLESDAIRDTNKTTRNYNISKQKLARS